MNITPIIEIIITAIVTLCTAYLIPFLKAKYGQAKIDGVLQTVDILVAAAEQIGKNRNYDGAAKRDYVITKLREQGLVVDETISDYIEAAVIELHGQLGK